MVPVNVETFHLGTGEKHNNLNHLNDPISIDEFNVCRRIDEMRSSDPFVFSFLLRSMCADINGMDELWKIYAF